MVCRGGHSSLYYLLMNVGLTQGVSYSYPGGGRGRDLGMHKFQRMEQNKTSHRWPWNAFDSLNRCSSIQHIISTIFLRQPVLTCDYGRRLLPLCPHLYPHLKSLKPFNFNNSLINSCQTSGFSKVGAIIKYNIMDFPVLIKMVLKLVYIICKNRIIR